MKDYEKLKRVNMALPPAYNYKYKGADYPINLVQESSKQTYKHMVYVLKKGKDQPILLHFGLDRKIYNLNWKDFESNFKKLVNPQSAHTKGGNGEFKVFDQTEWRYFYLRHCWPIKKWGSRSIVINNVKYNFHNTPIRP